MNEDTRAVARRVRNATRHGLRHWLNFHGQAGFEDRRTGADRVLLVLAGYKEYLWDYTLERIAAFVPENVDVCLVSPGRFCSRLQVVASTRSWSYLSSRDRNISLAQNLAIRLHDSARWIFKLDEDMFIERGFFDELQNGYLRIEAEGQYRVGMCAPVINVNGFSYVEFLRTLGLEEEYRRRFGELARAGDSVRAWSDGAAAVWLWEQSLPLEGVAALFARHPFGYSTVPHKFNIGAVLYRRDLWDELGGLPVKFPARVRIGMGDDETHLCGGAISHSRVTCVLHNVFAGHFGFKPQEEAMRGALPTFAPHLTIPVKHQTAKNLQ